jgi:hypothetical protein
MKLLLPFIFSMLGSSVFSQTVMEDVVYLHNGSVIKGKIIVSDVPATSDKIKIELQGGSVFVFQPSEIDSIKKENLQKNRLKEIKTNYYRKDRGFRNITEFGIINGMNLKNNSNDPNNNNAQQNDIGISLHTINGYQFWPYLFTGAGIGIDRFITYQQTFSPFYLRVASEFLKKKVTPYTFCDVGYSVMWPQFNTSSDGYAFYKNTGGFYLCAGGGVRIYTRSRASVLISIAYKRNSSQSSWAYNYEYYGYNEIYNISRTYQRLVMNLGVTF